MTAEDAMWTTNLPTSWPEPPQDMTVTSLLEIEACPRRWSLTNAEYPALWDGRGYPPQIQPAALGGTVVHSAVEVIAGALAQAGCSTVDSAEAIDVIKDLGGLTTVVRDRAEQALSRFATNPRTTPDLENARLALAGQLPSLRAVVQSVLSRLVLPGRSVARRPTAVAGVRQALGTGAFVEVAVRAGSLHWKGIIDLLLVADDACQIIDVKTGAPHEAHRFQLEVYALLWNRDEELNPSGRLATRLTLRYLGQDIDIDVPTVARLDGLEREVIERADLARTATAGSPPEARPSTENCRFCSVRQLCGEYWDGLGRHIDAWSAVDTRYGDLECSTTGRHGPSSWDAVVAAPAELAGARVVLRSRTRTLPSTGRIRVLNAALTHDGQEEDEPAIVTLGSVSEVYAVV